MSDEELQLDIKNKFVIIIIVISQTRHVHIRPDNLYSNIQVIYVKFITLSLKMQLYVIREIVKFKLY